jgi:hypothetical protein
MQEISADVSRQLGKDLTERYPATVYAMAKACHKLAPGSKITSTKVKAVTNSKCEVALVTCRGDLCEMHNAVYAFHPPLASADDFQKRISTIHNDVCAPKLYWLVTNPLALIIFITISGLAYGTLVLGVNGMVEALAQAPHLEEGVETIFGSTQTFAYAVWGAWYFAIIAHGIEAFIAVQHCSNTLQLEAGPTTTWAFLTFCVGYPIFSQLQELVQVQQAQMKSK